MQEATMIGRCPYSSFVSLALSALILSGCLMLPTADASLHGEWHAVDGDLIVVITFHPDQTLTMAADGQGDAVSGQYRVDMSSDPVHLDLALDGIGEIATIIEFPDGDTMRLADNAPGAPRPTSFGERSRLFTRVLTSDRAQTSTETPAEPEPQAVAEAGDRTESLRALLRYVPATPAYHRYLTFGDYAKWLDATNIERPADRDALEGQMTKREHDLWLFSMPGQTLPPAALAFQYMGMESMIDYVGFDFFGSNQYLEAGAPPDLLTVVTHQVDPETLAQSLTAIGYETQERSAGGARFSIRQDNMMDLEWPIAAGRLGELNRIDHVDDTLVIGRNTAVVDAALSASQGKSSLLDLSAYQALLASLNAPGLADVGALVGLIVQGEPVLPDVAGLLLGDDTPEEIRAQWEALTMQEPPLPLYLLTGLATYRTADGTYLALHTVFPAKETAVAATETLSERMQAYVSVRTDEPLPWTFDRAFSTGETAVVVMRLEESDERSANLTWMRMLLARDLLFLLTQ